ncbi:hypothetical protein SCLCIDRAFT_138653, partial [Scleroderma citrinum Foug A]
MQKKSLSILCAAKSSARSPQEFILRCKCHLLSGNVALPFWIGLPLCCIHSSITADILHQLYQGVIKYLLTWCSSLMSESELDQQLQTLPQCFGIRHFKHGWSKLSQILGNEQKQMARVLLGCLVGKVPNDVLTCYRALLDFLHLAQYPSHNDDSLGYMEEALSLFHDHKHIFITLGIRDIFNILKFHSLLHYVECIK